MRPPAASTGGARAFEALVADQARFRTWYDDALPRVYGYLLARCGDRSLAEEATQEAFVEAIRARRRFEGRSDPVTWVCAIGRNGLAVTLKQLIDSGGWHRLACLGNAPVTVEGVIDFHCQGGARSGTYQPLWMVDWCPTQTLTPAETVAKVAATPPMTLDHYTLDMVAPPGGPSVEPRGTIVRVTGHFDDPSAAGCRISAEADAWYPGVWDGAAVLLCREQFVVTNIEKLGFMALPPE